MSASAFALGLLALAAIVVPIFAGSCWLIRSWLALDRALAWLGVVVLSLSVLLVSGEALGIAHVMHAGELIAAAFAYAAVAWWLAGRSGPAAGAARRAASARRAEVVRAGPRAGSSGLGRSNAGGLIRLALPAALVVVVAQWIEGTANVLGGGILGFDSLWYHMPFAARFAQSGSVTAIPFTQADPYVAYYPANSELVHALGISAMHGDVLSPLINLIWLGVFLLACWCAGRRWSAQPYTLLAGCLCAGLPVLSTTQPGQAFSDIPGLTMLMAAVALLLSAGEQQGALALAGLALGFALGTKVTFLTPALVLCFGAPLLAPVGERMRTFALLAVPLVVTGAWWYVRDAVAVGNPLGARLQLGPLILGGPSSGLADEQQGTLITNLHHLSRFVPGLTHALGVFWPLILIGTLAGALAWLRPPAGRDVGARDPLVTLVSVAAAASALSYFFLPTSASGIAQGTQLFEVNLRYLTPAVALAAVLLPRLAARRGKAWLDGLAVVMLAALVAAQLEPSEWPTQTARHLAFLLATAVVVLAALRLPEHLLARRGQRPRGLGANTVLLVVAGVVVAAFGGAFALQRHYFDRRYLAASGRSAALFAWAQRVSHRRIALYGSLRQYPLYGAFTTNHVDYVGVHTGDGGFRPATACREWRSLIDAGHYDYVVLSPGPTAAVPETWTASAPTAHLVLAPGAGQYVFRLTGPLRPASCG